MLEMPRVPEEEPPTSSINTSKVSVLYIPGFKKLNPYVITIIVNAILVSFEIQYVLSYI